MKLSIITINYNNQVGLQRTIDSVLCQTWKDFEWLVIDGGSTDGSKELIEQYQEHFSYWCSEPDKGVYNGMNKGIKHAIGDYLLFLNSGDALYDPDVLQKFSELNTEADIISGQAERTDSHEQLRHYDKSLFMQLYVDTLNHQGTFIKSSLFKDALYDESLRITADWKFWMEKIVFGNAKVEVMDFFVVRQDMTGISSDHNMEGVQLQLKERQQLLGEFFPPMVHQALDDYQSLRESPYVIYGHHLKKSRFLHAIGWRFLKFLSLFVK